MMYMHLPLSYMYMLLPDLIFKKSYYSACAFQALYSTLPFLNCVVFLSSLKVSPYTENIHLRGAKLFYAYSGISTELHCVSVSRDKTLTSILVPVLVPVLEFHYSSRSSSGLKKSKTIVPFPVL